MDDSLTRRHYSPELPRFWITLPVAVRRAALDDPLLLGLFPSHVGFFPRASGHRITRPAGLASTIFNYCVEGQGYCRIRNVRHRVGPGDLMVVPAGEPHAYGSSSSEAWTLHWFHAMGTNVERLCKRLELTTAAPVLHLGRSPALEALFVEMREALEEDDSAEHLLYAAQVLAHLMGVMIRLRAHPRSEPSAVHRVAANLEYLKNHLGAPYDVGRLAALAALSASRYSELVRRATGYPPKEYLTRLRVERARQLLETTNDTVKVIASEVGFPDPLHFSRVFRRIEGANPRRYRAKASKRTSKSQ